MKNILRVGLIVILVVMMAVGCSSNTANEVPTDNGNVEETATTESETTTESDTTTEEDSSMTYADGLYFAIQDEFSEESGWKDTVTIEVKDGMIVSVNWSGVSINGGMDKKAYSEAGLYGMMAYSKATAEWHDQAVLAEAYLIETQDPTAIEYQADNYHTDAIAGVSIGVSPFFGLAEQALAAGPQQPGPYKDGAYHAESAEFDAESGYKETVDITVAFGNIEAVNWSGIHKDGGDDKKTRSINGDYGMTAYSDAKMPWFEQAALAEAHLIETQDPTAIEYQADNYHTDAIAGVSIGVSPFFSLVEEALKDAK